MLRTSIVVLSLLAASPSFARSSHPNTNEDNRHCMVMYDAVRKYVTEYNSFLWKLHKNNVIHYDSYMYGQNENILHSRYYTSAIRNRAYVGKALECDLLALEAKQVVDGVMTKFMVDHGLNKRK